MKNIWIFDVKGKLRIKGEYLMTEDDGNLKW